MNADLAIVKKTSASFSGGRGIDERLHAILTIQIRLRAFVKSDLFGISVGIGLTEWHCQCGENTSDMGLSTVAGSSRQGNQTDSHPVLLAGGEMVSQ